MNRPMRPGIFPFSRLSVIAAAMVAAALAGGACTGSIGDPDGGGVGDDGGPGAAAKFVADHSRFPRLSHSQWENTVKDLLRLDAPTGLSTSFYPDALGGRAFDNNEAALSVTPELWGDYERAAEDVATMVAADPAKIAKILPADMPTEPAAKRDAFVASFGLRAFRRPLTADEKSTFGAIFDQGQTLDSTDAFTAGVRLSIEAFLQSPFFVYRAELSTKPADDKLIHLDGYEVASKLSYTLWNTMPDDTLFATAASGALDTPEGIEAQINTMVDDPRSKARMVSFHHQLLSAGEYTNLVDKSPDLFPDFDKAVGADMETELDMFVEKVVVEDGGGLKELLTSPVTFVNSRIAAIYGLDTAGRSVDQFEEVSLDPAQRAGFLTRSGFLAWKGTYAAPDTILRGVFINRKILCQVLGDPPPAAAGAKLGDETTDRERVEALTGKGTCGESCHGNFIDPVGYAFENFDAIGQWREQDNGVPVDATSSFPFDGTMQSFSNASELSALIASSEQANTCYSRYWLQFAYGRDVVDDKDQSIIDELTALSRGGGSTRDMVVTLLTNNSFLTHTTAEVGQ